MLYTDFENYNLKQKQNSVSTLKLTNLFYILNTYIVVFVYKLRIYCKMHTYQCIDI